MSLMIKEKFQRNLNNYIKANQCIRDDELNIDLIETALFCEPDLSMEEILDECKIALNADYVSLAYVKNGKYYSNMVSDNVEEEN